MEERKFYTNNFCCFHLVQMCQVTNASFFGVLSPIKLQVDLGEVHTLKNDAHNSPPPPVLSSCVHYIHHQPGKPSWGGWWQWLSNTGVMCPPQLSQLGTGQCPVPWLGFRAVPQTAPVPPARDRPSSGRQWGWLGFAWSKQATKS